MCTFVNTICAYCKTFGYYNSKIEFILDTSVYVLKKKDNFFYFFIITSKLQAYRLLPYLWVFKEFISMKIIVSNQ